MQRVRGGAGCKPRQHGFGVCAADHYITSHVPPHIYVPHKTAPVPLQPIGCVTSGRSPASLNFGFLAGQWGRLAVITQGFWEAAWDCKNSLLRAWNKIGAQRMLTAAPPRAVPRESMDCLETKSMLHPSNQSDKFPLSLSHRFFVSSS